MVNKGCAYQTLGDKAQELLLSRQGLVEEDMAMLDWMMETGHVLPFPLYSRTQTLARWLGKTSYWTAILLQ